MSANTSPTPKIDRCDPEIYALLCGVQAMKIHIRSGGKMMLTRIATPANIASRFNLIDPKTGKAPRTAKTILPLLEAKLAAFEKARGIDPESMVQRASPVISGTGTLPTPN